MINVILHGYKGRMGQVLIDLIGQATDMQVVAGVDGNAQATDEAQGFSTFGAIADCDTPADVIIDFSNHLAVPALLDYSVKTGIPVVVATTALTEEEKAQMVEASTQVPVFNSSNMSLGINLVAKCLQQIMPALEADFNVEIVEKHHNMKKDSPSGTALLLADAANEACKEKKEYIYGRHGSEDECKISQMGIHAVRGGTIPGEH
ncbi:MAG: 4-hydroxy-tetrahydrodipicolinate reductase, partial [Anaerovoracaceae bacterium]